MERQDSREYNQFGATSNMTGNKRARILTILLISLVLLAGAVLLRSYIKSHPPEEPLPPVVRDYDKLVLTDATATLEQAEGWAKRNGANKLFMSLAPIYWELAVEYGVDPVVAYTQAALETGFAKFGGVLDETYMNPCGLKTSGGGDDYDAAAHQRFSSWEEGIRAHYEHLALYAGQDGYPLEEPIDPRHFVYLVGTAKTVGEVSLSWATAGSYAEDWTYLIDRLQVNP